MYLGLWPTSPRCDLFVTVGGGHTFGNGILHGVFLVMSRLNFRAVHSRKLTQNDGLEKVTPFKNGDFWYLY